MQPPKIVLRCLLAGLGCVLLLVVIYGAAVWTHAGQRFEDSVLRAADASRHHGGAVDLLRPATVGGLGVASVVVLAVGRLRGGWALALAGVGVIAGALLTSEVLQLGLVRPVLLSHGYRRSDHSFPSGHTTIAMAVMCALVLVTPYRLRPAAVAVTSAGATGVGLLTVYASWHRPSDTLGSGVIALAWAAAAVLLLGRYGRVRRPAPPGGLGRAATWLLAGLLAAGAVAGFALGAVDSRRVLHDLAAHPAEPSLVPGGALAGGLAVTAAGGAAVALALLVLLRRLEPLRPERLAGPAAGAHQYSGGVMGGPGAVRPARPSYPPTGPVR